MAKTYRYYTLYRPPELGTVPRGFCEVVCFDERRYCPQVGREAWGYVEYEQPLSPQEIINYELASAQ